jgi:hypothetical protein
MRHIEVDVRRSGKRGLSFRTELKLNADWRDVQVMSEQNSQNSVRDDERIPVLLELESRRALFFISSEIGHKPLGNRFRWIDTDSPYIDISPGQVEGTARTVLGFHRPKQLSLLLTSCSNLGRPSYRIGNDGRDARILGTSSKLLPRCVQNPALREGEAPPRCLSQSNPPGADQSADH